MEFTDWVIDPEVRSAHIYRGSDRSMEAAVSDAIYTWDPYLELSCDGAPEYRRAYESAKRVPAAYPTLIASVMRLSGASCDAASVKRETDLLNLTVRRCASLSGLMPFRDALELRRALLYIRSVEARGGVYDDSYVESVLSVQRSLASELSVSGELIDGTGKDIAVVLDGSDGMQGEPTILAKAFVLMLIRVFGSQRRIDVRSTCPDAEWSFVPGRSRTEDVIRMLMYIPGEGDDCGAAVRQALNDMKQDRLRDRVLIVVSQAKGLVNSMALHDDWNRFRSENSVRTFSVIPGASEAKGLTELSESVLYIKPEGVLEKDGKFTAFMKQL